MTSSAVAVGLMVILFSLAAGTVTWPLDVEVLTAIPESVMTSRPFPVPLPAPNPTSKLASLMSTTALAPAMLMVTSAASVPLEVL